MIQPVRHKDTKLGQEEISRLVKRLYPEQEKQSLRKQYRHLNKTGLNYLLRDRKDRENSVQKWRKSMLHLEDYSQERQKLENRSSYGRMIWESLRKK